MTQEQIITTIYHDARCVLSATPQYSFFVIRLTYGNGINISDGFQDEQDAWHNAYLRIKGVINQLTT